MKIVTGQVIGVSVRILMIGRGDHLRKSSIFGDFFTELPTL